MTSVEQRQISKLARSDEPKVNQVQMKSKAQSGKRLVLSSFAKGRNI
jgi:hypothetical protein